MTRRARKHSKLSATVLQWSRSRKRYERQGLLVEEQGLQAAEQECLSDAEVRDRRREREAVRRQEVDKEYVARFAARIRELFPACPADREMEISEHACMKYSGRVGRSGAAKELDEDAVELAVRAHIRHSETDYDSLLNEGGERSEARSIVRSQVERMLISGGEFKASSCAREALRRQRATTKREKDCYHCQRNLRLRVFAL